MTLPRRTVALLLGLLGLPLLVFGGLLGVSDRSARAQTNLVYTVDAARGVDVYEVTDLPVSGSGGSGAPGASTCGPAQLPAHGRERWSLRKRVALPADILWSRATNAAGRIERKARTHNLAARRVR